jgi:hypothetical protein
MKPVFFANQTGFRNWLAKNHKKKTGLLAGFYKVGGTFTLKKHRDLQVTVFCHNINRV